MLVFSLWRAPASLLYTSSIVVPTPTDNNLYTYVLRSYEVADRKMTKRSNPETVVQGKYRRNKNASLMTRCIKYAFSALRSHQPTF